MKLPKGFSSKYLNQKNAQELLLTAAKKWGIELNEDEVQEAGIKFKRNMKFFNNGNVYPMWIIQGLRCNEVLDRIDEVVVYCDMESGLHYYVKANDCTIFRLPEFISIKGILLERKEKSNTVIYAPKKN